MSQKPEDYQHLHVEFYLEAVPDENATIKEGRPIFKEREQCRWIAPGEKDTGVNLAHEASPARGPNRMPLTWAQLFPRQYDAFKNGLGVHLNGTPLSEASFISLAKRKELEALSIFTVEQLAGLEGTPLQRLGPGGRALKTQAEAYIDKASGSAIVGKAMAENDALKKRIEALEAMMKGAVPADDEDEEEEDIPTASPFETWDDADIRVWLAENGGPSLPLKVSRAKLLSTAGAHNDALRKKSKKEAA